MKPSPMKDPTNYVRKEDFYKMLEYARNERDEMLLKFLWYTGCRISEALRTRVKDIDFIDGILVIHEGKTRTSTRSIPIKRDFLKELEIYIDKNKLRPNDRLFNITQQRAWQIIKDISERSGVKTAGGKTVRPHTLRHSFAIICLDNGTPIHIVSQWMGHASYNMTAEYSRLTAKDTKKYIENVEF